MGGWVGRGGGWDCVGGLWEGECEAEWEVGGGGGGAESACGAAVLGARRAGVVVEVGERVGRAVSPPRSPNPADVSCDVVSGALSESLIVIFPFSLSRAAVDALL